MDDDLFKKINRIMEEELSNITVRQAYGMAMKGAVGSLQPGQPAQALLISMGILVLLMAERQGIDLDQTYKHCVDEILAKLKDSGEQS